MASVPGRLRRHDGFSSVRVALRWTISRPATLLPLPCKYIVAYLRKYINRQNTYTFANIFVDNVYLQKYIFADIMLY